jgi:hypothetical protein
MTEKRQRCATAADTRATTSAHLELAAEAILDGWTRERVINALIGRIKRGEGYLAYRRACGKRTRYDKQVTADLPALALAVCRLSDPLEQATAPRGLAQLCKRAGTLADQGAAVWGA